MGDNRDGGGGSGTGYDDDDDDDSLLLADFLAWCDARGVARRSVAPALVAEGWRGVVATAPVAAGDAVVRVPEACLMSALSARRDAAFAAALARAERGSSSGGGGSPAAAAAAAAAVGRAAVGAAAGARRDQQPPPSPPSSSLPSRVVLAAHLLHEAGRGAASRWAPYVRQLPRAYTTLLTWPDDAAAALQLPAAREAAAAAAGAARADWALARPLLQELGPPARLRGWGAWAWASSTVASRTMFLPHEPACGCLTPFGDLFNHAPAAAPFTPDIAADAAALVGRDGGGGNGGSNGGSAAEAAPPALGNIEAADAAAPAAAAAAAANATSSSGDDDDGGGGVAGDGHFDAAAAAYVVVARRGYARGEQVLLCYGRHAGLALLELYGFAPPAEANPHDAAPLRRAAVGLALAQQVALAAAAPSPTPPPRARRAGGAPTAGLPAPSAAGMELGVSDAECAVHANGQPFWQLLCALRLAAASSLAEARSGGHLARAGEPISAASERLALRALAAACDAQLAALPTTCAEDEALLRELEAGLRRDRQRQAAAERGVHGEPQRWPPARHAQECLALAVAWRASYKRTLARCVAHCRAALVLLPGTAGDEL